MGMSNELCAEKYNVSREDQDQFAAESYKKAMDAIQSGKFKEEIVPIKIPQRKCISRNPRIIIALDA